MAVVDGALGTAVISGNFSAIIINVYQWTATADNVFFDSRVFDGASNGVQEYRGPYQITGTLSGYLDGTVPTVVITHMNPGAAASTAITLTSFTGRIWTFAGHLHGFSPAVHRYEGLNSYTCQFRSHGSVTSFA